MELDKTMQGAETSTPVVRMSRAQREALLPPYYKRGKKSFMKVAQERDPDFVHKWVNISARNQQMKIWKGWIPVEDPEELKRLGLFGIVFKANGRARWMDTELWRMPKDVAAAIKETSEEELAEQSSSQRAALDAMAEETTGRSRGKAIPFITTGGGGDVFDRTPVAAPATKKG